MNQNCDQCGTPVRKVALGTYWCPTCGSLEMQQGTFGRVFKGVPKLVSACRQGQCSETLELLRKPDEMADG